MADERKYFVLCADNCKFESMTKEQIIAAIAEATGKTPTDIDSAFISKIKEINKGATVQLWLGTTAEYNAIAEKRSDVIYIKTDDTRIDDIEKNVEANTENIDKIGTDLSALAADTGITKTYNLTVDLETMKLTFTGKQTANELYNDLENKKDISVVATAANGTQLYLIPTYKTGVINGYLFECNDIGSFMSYSWAFTKNGFSDCITVNLYSFFAKGFQRVLTSADDCDNLFDDGVYVYSTASVPANAPFENAAVIEVFGADSTTTQKIQRAYRYGEAGHSAFRPLYNSKWGVWAKPLIMNEQTVTKTTTDNGNCSLDLDLDSYIVISAYCVVGNAAKVCIPYRANTTHNWAVKVIDSATDGVIANTDVTITYFYVRR